MSDTDNEQSGEQPNLRAMTRAELNEYATAQGIADAEGFANKDELAAAIETDAGKSGETAADASDASDASADDGETAADEEPDSTGAEAVKEARFRVLKAFTLDDGRTVMPGEEFDPASVEKWPARRTTQLTEQKYLRPIG